MHIRKRYAPFVLFKLNLYWFFLLVPSTERLNIPFLLSLFSFFFCLIIFFVLEVKTNKTVK